MEGRLRSNSDEVEIEKTPHQKEGGDFLKKEGRRIKTLAPMNVMEAYIMPNRNGSSNIFSCDIDITETEKFISKKRKEGLKGLGLMHILMASYVRTIAEYPGINRFVRGQKIYARNNIEMCLTIKKEMALDAQETVVKIFPDASDNLDDIYSKVNKAVIENRGVGDGNAMDTIARVLVMIPGVFLKFAVWSLKLADYFGLLPRFLTKASPFHASMFITNMGSLGIGPVFHHLYDFGNVPVFLSLGTKRTAYVVAKDGTVEKRRLVGITVVCDERICDGHYYSKAFKKLKSLLENSEKLENKASIVKEDIR